MDKLFKLVFNNNVIRKNIFKYITIHNKECRYIRYNYYNIPFEIVLKSRNEQLLNEKLSNYIKYFKSSENDNEEAAVTAGAEDNQDDFNNFYKYYILFNKASLNELLNWKELSNQTFELIFKIFENEIKSIIIENNFQFGNIQNLIFDGCLNKLKYLISNKWITNINQFLVYQFSSFYYSSSSRNFNIISNKTIENFNYFYKELYSLHQGITTININIYPYSLSTNAVDTLFEILLIIVRERNNNKEIINNFKELLIELLPTTTTTTNNQELLIPKNKEKTIETIFNEIFKNDDLFTLKLFLKKFQIQDKEISLKLFDDEKTIIFLYGYKISLNSLKSFNINPVHLLQSLMIDLVKIYIDFIPETFSNERYFPKEFNNPIKIILNSPEIALLLMERDLAIVQRTCSISINCNCLLLKMGKRKLVQSMETTWAWNLIPNKSIEPNVFQYLFGHASGLQILFLNIIQTDDIELLKSNDILLFPYLSTSLLNELFKRNNQEMIKYILEYLKRKVKNSITQLPSGIQNVLSTLFQTLIEYNQSEYFDFICSIIDLDPDKSKYYILTNLRKWILDNWELARKWFNNSKSIYIKKEYQSLVDSILYGYLVSSYFCNIETLPYCVPKIVISELTSRDPITEPLPQNFYYVDSIVRNNIIVMGLSLGLTFDNDEIEFFGFNKTSNRGNKIINSFYIGKGLIQNLFKQIEIKDSGFNNISGNGTSSSSSNNNHDQLFLIKNYLLKLMIIDSINIFKHIDQIIKVSIITNNQTIINFILSSSNKFKKLNLFNSLLNFKFNQITSSSSTTTTTKKTSKKLKFQNKNQFFNWIHYLIFKNSTKDNQEIITNLVNQNYLYKQQQQTNDQLCLLKFTKLSLSENNIKFLENVGLLSNSINNNSNSTTTTTSSYSSSNSNDLIISGLDLNENFKFNFNK